MAVTQLARLAHSEDAGTEAREQRGGRSRTSGAIESACVNSVYDASEWYRWLIYHRKLSVSRPTLRSEMVSFAQPRSAEHPSGRGADEGGSGISNKRAC